MKILAPTTSVTEKRIVIPKAMIKILEEQPVIVSKGGFNGMIPVAWEKLKDAAAIKAMLDSKELTQNFELVLMEK